jgi:hypothetical protein
MQKPLRKCRQCGIEAHEEQDLIYHQGLDAWKSAIQAVKEEFPK